jgi:hypothetical protein
MFDLMEEKESICNWKLIQYSLKLWQIAEKLVHLKLQMEWVFVEIVAN